MRSHDGVVSVSHPALWATFTEAEKRLIPLYKGGAYSDLLGWFLFSPRPSGIPREEQVDLILLLSGHWHILYDLLYFINPQAMAWNTFQLNIVPQENISLLEIMIYQYLRYQHY